MSRPTSSKGPPVTRLYTHLPAFPASIVSVCLGALFTALLLVACKSNTGPTTDRPLDPPTNPHAYSLDDSTVVVFWSASRSKDLSVFDKYRVTATDDTGGIAATEFTTLGSDTSVSVSGLHPARSYSFGIVATVISSASGYTESQPAVIEWAPAPRFSADTSGLLHLYETIGYPDSSGLVVFDTALAGPRRVSLLSPGRDSLSLDIVVTSLGTPMYIGSAEYYSTGWRKTRFSTVIDFSSSLDYPRSAPPDTSTYTLTFLEVPNTLTSRSAIVYFRTQEGNYGRMLLERDPSKGILIWGPYPYRWLTVQLSYQTTPDIPYSERARQTEEKR